MSTLQQRIAAVQQGLNAQESNASPIKLAPIPRPATDDISQQSPQSIRQGQAARPDLNVPISGDDLEKQLTDLAEQTTGGSISINGQMMSSGGGGGNALTSALGGVLQQLQPAAKSHLLTQKMVQDAIGQTVTDVTKDQLGVSRASRDVQALSQQRANGTLSDQAYEAAIAQAKNGQAGYTFDQLVRAPGGAQLLGVQSQIESAKEKTLQDYADSNGWDRSEVKWDEKQNGPTPDYQTADFNFRRAQQKEIETKAQHYPDKIKADNRKAAIDSLHKLITSTQSTIRGRTNAQTGVPEPATPDEENKLQLWTGQLQKLIGDDGQGNIITPAAPTGKPVAPQPAAPAGANGAPSVSVNSLDEIRGGLASNKWKPGTIIQIGSEQGIVTGDPAAPLKPVK